MIRYDRRRQSLAAALAALAGYVDAIGFVKMGGLFVSFMSGNTTRMAVGMAGGSAVAAMAAALIAAFLIGVIGGALVAAASGAARKTAVLSLTAALLGVAAVLERFVSGNWTAIAMAAAMGTTNNVFLRGGEVSVGVTYMTGTLVKLGQRIAAALMGDGAGEWLAYLRLWLGLLAGAVSGALLYPRIGSLSLALAAVAATGLALAARRLGPSEPYPRRTHQ
ncbi:MAG: YoaK family protein [Sphingomonas bacterium]